MDRQPAFGGDRPTLGVELELQLVDAETLALRPAFDEVHAGLPEAVRDSVKPEFHSSCLEVNSGICLDVDEVGRDLGPKIAAVARAASARGVLLAWGGTHPFSHWRDQPITDHPRYGALAERYGETLLRQLTYGLHVHVAVPSADAAARACDRLRTHLPALLALSANSPFWCGRATGFHSHRIEVMSGLPGGGMSPALGDWEGFARLVDRLVACRVITSFKDLWWDVRPSPNFGTVEVRVCDMPADLATVQAIAALIQCLVHAECRGGQAAEAPSGEVAALVLAQDRWRAARFGLDAELIDPLFGEARRALDVLCGLAESLADVATDLNCRHHLEHVRGLAGRPGGARRQVEVFERSGDLRDVVRHMAGLRPGGRGLRSGAFQSPALDPPTTDLCLAPAHPY